MRKLIGIVGLAAAALLAGCGGGGGSPGDTREQYSITLRADKQSLPLNFTREWPYLNGYVGSGVSAPYTTTLYVQAKQGNDPIPGSENAFECDVKGGLDTGVLMYMDGDKEHYEEVDLPDGSKVRVEKAYRSVVLGANSGGNSFHLHALDQAGVATITCAVTDPRDNRRYAASVDINVGGGSGTGKAASIKTIATYPTLGTLGNVNNLRISTDIQAYVLDDALQPVPNGGSPNLLVRIRPGLAATGARLLSGPQQGSEIRLRTTGGVGLFALSSGLEPGPIVIEMTADRFDNDVTNGIQDPITGLYVVNTTDGTPPGVAPDPIEFVDITPADATIGLPYSYMLTAKGGEAPYMWKALGGLPAGLTLTETGPEAGLLSGSPTRDEDVGDISIAVRVTDNKGVSKTTNVKLAVKMPAT